MIYYLGVSQGDLCHCPHRPYLSQLPLGFYSFILNILKVKVKLHGGNKIPHTTLNINIKTEIMIELHRVVQNIFPSIPKGLYQAIPFLSEDCSSFPQ